MTYRPPTKVVTRQTSFLSLVTGADPDWARYKYWEVEYITSQRAIMANPYQRGAYNRLGNAYPVGAQYGTPDLLVESALEPTAGNPLPGLYSQTITHAPQDDALQMEDGSYFTTEDDSDYLEQG